MGESISQATNRRKVDKDERWLIIKLQTIRQLVLSRATLIPAISSLAATLLVVATFNEELIPITVPLKIGLSVLILFIPTGLIFGLMELDMAIQKQVASIEKDPQQL